MVKRVAVNSTEWTPIYPPRAQSACAFYSLDGQDLLLRSDPEDATTEWPLSGNAQEIRLNTSVPTQVGKPIFWAKQVVPGSSFAIVKMP